MEGKGSKKYVPSIMAINLGKIMKSTTTAYITRN